MIYRKYGETQQIRTDCFKIYTVPTEMVNAFKILGVLFDDQLQWTAHIKCLKCIYNTFFLPYINLCNIIRGGACRTALNQIDIVLRRALKAIFCVNRRTSTRLICSELKDFTVSQLYEIQMLTFMSKYSNFMLSVPLSNLL